MPSILTTGTPGKSLLTDALKTLRKMTLEVKYNTFQGYCVNLVAFALVGFVALGAFPKKDTQMAIAPVVMCALVALIVLAVISVKIFGILENKQAHKILSETKELLESEGFSCTDKAARHSLSSRKGISKAFHHDDGRAFYIDVVFDDKNNMDIRVRYRLHYQADPISIHHSDIWAMLSLYDPGGSYPLVS